MAVNSRPLTLGEILDHTIQIFKRNFLLFAGTSILPSAVYVLTMGAFGVYYTTSLPAMAAAGPNSFQGALGLMLAFGLFIVVGIPLLLGSYALGTSALNFAALQVNHSLPVTIRSAYAYAFRNFWRSLGLLSLQVLFAGVIPGVVFFVALFVTVMIIVGVTAALGKVAAGVLTILLMLGLMLAFFAVACWIWLRLCLAFPASVAEGRKVWDSIKRSNQLSKGTRGRIFVMYLLVFILAFIATYALVIPLDFALGFRFDRIFAPGSRAGVVPVVVQIANLVVSFLGRIVIMPVPLIAVVLFYQDQRTRNEGYDIEQLMAQAGWSNLPPPITTAALTPAEAGAPALLQAAPFAESPQQAVVPQAPQTEAMTSEPTAPEANPPETALPSHPLEDRTA
jgi:membrane-anchored glycerophosphoryl diester phosphodiesterase (GDPDase)